MELRTKEVYFGEYCRKCKYYENSPSDDPCDDCLNEPSNEYSHKPVYFKEAQHVHNKLFSQLQYS